MGRSCCLFIILSCFLILQTFENGVIADGCYGSLFAVNSSYGENRDQIFSSLATDVVANGGFYNTSLGRDSNRIYVVALCGRGYKRQGCLDCVVGTIQRTLEDCPQRTESSLWGTGENDDAICLVRYTNDSTSGKLQLKPLTIQTTTQSIEDYKNMTLFRQEWEAMVNRTVTAASVASTSSLVKYYGAAREEFTEYRDVYSLMLCTPDISSNECNRCLTENVLDFQSRQWGAKGAGIWRPSCYFRWDLYSFSDAFENVTSVPALTQGDEDSNSQKDKKGRRSRYGTIAIILVPTVINLVVFAAFIIGFSWRRKSYIKINNDCFVFDGQPMLRFSLGVILTATDDFSNDNKLGQGGFGTVYKGIFKNGQEIAVKRLVRGMGQGDVEFKNEVSLLTRLQHRNLVKLLGFCSEGDEEILVYEFVPNSSLDHFIFHEDKRPLLTWDVRRRIIQGVARGLVYLHEDSQLKIIHRDLKASNILLDAEMNPKVADFGTARLFHTDETRAETRRIAGTRGYMAPEYLNHGKISAKCDVYSFGVMLLEMISGERNSSFEEGLGAFAWNRWVEGKPEIVIDPLLMKDPINEIIKLIQIGLLCVQENAATRPTMSSVIVWFGSETITIPLPKTPAFTGCQSHSENGTISMSNNLFTELSFR